MWYTCIHICAQCHRQEVAARSHSTSKIDSWSIWKRRSKPLCQRCSLWVLWSATGLPYILPCIKTTMSVLHCVTYPAQSPLFRFCYLFPYSPSFIGYCSVVLSVITSSDYEISWKDFYLYSFPITRNFPSAWELTVSLNPQTIFNVLNYKSG